MVPLAAGLTEEAADPAEPAGLAEAAAPLVAAAEVAGLADAAGAAELGGALAGAAAPPPHAASVMLNPIAEMNFAFLNVTFSFAF